MSSQEINITEEVFSTFKNNMDGENKNERIKENNNFISSFPSPNSDLINNQNNYIQTNTSLIRKEPILIQNNFHDIINKFKIFEVNNNIPSFNQNKNNKIITLKKNIKNPETNICDFNSNENQYSFKNSNKLEQNELITNSNENNKKNSNISNKEKKIEIINIQNLNPEEKSFNNSNCNSNLINNTIKIIDDEGEEDNIMMNYPITNNNFLNNKSNKNNMLDIDAFSESNSNCQDININKNLNEFKNIEIFNTFNKNNQTQDDFPPSSAPSKKIEYFPEQISPLITKNEIIFSDNSKNNNLSNDISPLIKILNNKNDFNQNSCINDYYRNNSILNKNSFNQLTSLINHKEQEYLEKNGNPEDINPIKNYLIELNKKDNNNKDPLNSQPKMIKNLNERNISNDNNINNQSQNDDIYEKNNINSDEFPTQIKTSTEIKILSNSNDDIIEDNNNNINNEQFNCLNSIKEIPQEKEFEITNLSFISSLNFQKILDKVKFKELLENLNKNEKIYLQEIGENKIENKEQFKENVLKNQKYKNKKKIMETIDEDENESKYDQDSFKISRKNSRKRIILLQDKNKIENSWKSLDKIYSNNYENKNIDSNEQYSTPKSEIKIEKIQKIHKKESNNKVEVKNDENPDYHEFYNEENNNRNNKEIENIKKNKIINPPNIDVNKININKFILPKKFKEIDEKFKEHFELINIENKDNIKSLNELNNNKLYSLFENIIKKDDTNNNNIKNYSIDNLFNKPYESYNKDNSLNNFGQNKNIKENNISNFNPNTNNFDEKENLNNNNIKDKDLEDKEEILSKKSNGLNNNIENYVESQKNKFTYTEKIIINNDSYNPFNPNLNDNSQINSNEKDFKKNENNFNENAFINNNTFDNKKHLITNKNGNEDNFTDKKMHTIQNQIKDEIESKENNNFNNNGESNYLINSNEFNKSNKVNNEILLSNNSKNKKLNNIKDDNINNIIQGSRIDSNYNDIRKRQNTINNFDEKEISKEYDFDVDDDNDYILINNFKSNNIINGINDKINNKEKNENVYSNIEKKEENYFADEENIKDNNIESNHDTQNLNNKNDTNFNVFPSQKIDEKLLINISNNQELTDYNEYIRSPEANSPIKKSKNLSYNKENLKIINLFDDKKGKNLNKIRKIKIEQINSILKNQKDLNLKINNEESIKDYLKYRIIDEKNNKILFSNDINKANKIYGIKLISYLIIMKKINSKMTITTKNEYKSFIKKLIIKTNQHIQEIQTSNNESNKLFIIFNFFYYFNFDIISDETLNFLFKNFKKKLKLFRDSYTYYLNGKKDTLNNLNKINNLKEKANIPGKKEEFKNAFRDLIKYINKVHKNSPIQKSTCYQKVIDYLKEYKNIDEETDKLDKNTNLMVKPKFNDKLVKIAYLIGCILITLFYLIRFFYSNLK